MFCLVIAEDQAPKIICLGKSWSMSKFSLRGRNVRLCLSSMRTDANADYRQQQPDKQRKSPLSLV